ncbi:unnamed protein product [[Candida] boidinii]|uniref:Unnamed protein product n=1 Tax=Candida boidinii TaxID=5477 RepID=A0A9W6SYJ8_CANBO|nr:unnamed protein product [[Candida] boidinii]
MSGGIPKGFQLLPVCGLLTCLTVGIPLAVSVLDLKYIFVFGFDPFITQWGQYWRFLIFQLSYQSESQVIVSVTLFHMALKNLERIFGSKKFASIVILSFLYNIIFTAGISVFLYSILGINTVVSSGPLGLIYSLLYLYWKKTPTMYRFELHFSGLKNFFGLKNIIKLPSDPTRESLIERQQQQQEEPQHPNDSDNEIKITITDGIFVKILALQLFFSEGYVHSQIPCLIGYFIGVLMAYEILPVKDSKIYILEKLLSLIFRKQKRRRTLEQDLASLQETTGDVSIHQLSRASTINNVNGGQSNANQEGDEIEDEDEDDDDELTTPEADDNAATPVRPLGTQILDTFRR